MTVRDLIKRLRRGASIKTFDGETPLFHRGERTQYMYGVLHGEAILRRFTAEGGEIVIHRARSESLFAEAALFSDHYHCDGHVVAGSRVALFSKTAMLQTMAQDTDFAIAFSQRLASQVQSLRSMMELRGIRNAEERIIAALSLRLADGHDTLVLNGSWKDFAQDIGLTHEALYRALQRLEQAKRLSRSGTEVQLMI